MAGKGANGQLAGVRAVRAHCGWCRPLLTRRELSIRCVHERADSGRRGTTGGRGVDEPTGGSRCPCRYTGRRRPPPGASSCSSTRPILSKWSRRSAAFFAGPGRGGVAPRARGRWTPARRRARGRGVGSRTRPGKRALLAGAGTAGALSTAQSTRSSSRDPGGGPTWRRCSTGRAMDDHRARGGRCPGGEGAGSNDEDAVRDEESEIEK
jgi:hypothetical protein